MKPQVTVSTLYLQPEEHENVLLVVDNPPRGCLDMPMVITHENVHAKLGRQIGHLGLLAVQDVLGTGVGSFQVMRASYGAGVRIKHNYQESFSDEVSANIGLSRAEVFLRISAGEQSLQDDVQSYTSLAQAQLTPYVGLQRDFNDSVQANVVLSKAELTTYTPLSHTLHDAIQASINLSNAEVFSYSEINHVCNDTTQANTALTSAILSVYQGINQSIHDDVLSTISLYKADLSVYQGVHKDLHDDVQSTIGLVNADLTTYESDQYVDYATLSDKHDTATFQDKLNVSPSIVSVEYQKYQSTGELADDVQNDLKVVSVEFLNSLDNL